MTDDYGQWRWNLFEHQFLASVLLRIASVKVLPSGRVSGRICWGLTSTKQFTVRSTYGICSPIHFGPDEQVWRHLTMDGSCWFCGDPWEDIDHVFRRCPIPFSIWLPLIRKDRIEREVVVASVQGSAGTLLGPDKVPVLDRSWWVRISHVGRGGNCDVDWMAKQASSGDLLCHWYLSPPDGISLLLQQDVAD
ncbi:hypothetical protein V6N11_017968 [Hibiscus sabdariffa]|uniref:Reverse transcriptase zinc-binding domain-containing protein n=1 Tax=Hibiscus sabdariffa TaxID=183260 RepID=A0ABR2T610_9ROSI